MLTYDEGVARSLERTLIDMIRSGKLGRRPGGLVEKFEEEFARYHDSRFGVATTSATMGLFLSYLAFGIGPGDKVVVPAYTFIATASSAILLRAKPVFVDVDLATLNMDVEHLAQVLEEDKGEGIRAVVPVHFAGTPAEMDAIRSLASKYNIGVIEDAAQAHGAIYKGRKVGSIGDAAVFSFQSSKLMSAGEGGIVLTNDEKLYDKIWALHNVGRRRGGAWYEHELVGWNMRMTELQAAVLLHQLNVLEKALTVLRRNASILHDLLEDVKGLQPIKPPSHVASSYYLFPIRLTDEVLSKVSKWKFVENARKYGVELSPGYDKPLYKQKAFQVAYWGLSEKYDGLELKNSETACREVVWLHYRSLLIDEDGIHELARNLRKAIADLP